jgi:hypothetical protein
VTSPSEYRYLFADLLTNAVYAELPLRNVSFSRELNTSGSFSGQLLLSDSRETLYDVSNTTIPTKTAIYVDRDGVLIWGGIIWSRTYDSQTQTISFTATEFESYFQHRRITQDFTFFGVDQLTAVQDVINSIQSAPNGNIGVVVGTETSGITIDKDIYDYELKPCLEFVYELSKGSSGFDFSIDVSYGTGNTLNKTLYLEYPRRGKVYSQDDPTALMLEFPGNVIAYTYPEDGSRTANTMYGIGGGQGLLSVISVQQDTTQLALGYPLLENIVSYTDYSDEAVLDELTLGELNAYVNPVNIITVSFPTDTADPLYGTYDTGDDVRIRITDDRFPNTLDIVRRISQISFEVGDNGADIVTLSLVNTPS